MKSILLASASVVAFAGAAAAEITWSGSAVLGYNDTDIDPLGGDDTEGFYWDLDIDVTLSQTLDNGLTAGATFGFEVAEDNAGTVAGRHGQALISEDYVLFLESDTAGLFFGDTDMAAQTHWSAVGDMEADGFSETDGETVIRGDLSYGSVDVSLSYVVAQTAITDDQGTVATADDVVYTDIRFNDMVQLSLGATAEVGNFTIALAYQEAAPAADILMNNGVTPVGATTYANGDFNADEIFGISVSTTFGAADVALGYAKNQTSGADSLGVEVAYPFGPVTATFYYVSESAAAGDNWGINVAYEDGPISVALDYQDDQGTQLIELEGSYDVGNGLIIYAGYLTSSAAGTDDAFYVGGEMDLGGGASLLVSYADAPSEAAGDDDVGAQDYQVGTTVEVSFEF